MRLPATEALGSAFRRFWLGETVSLLGTQVTALALPLTAILALDAGPAELGLLGAAGFLPFLVLALPAGAWIDRRRRRPVLVAANAGRALLIGLVPASALLGVLRFELLLVVALAVGALTVLFEVGYLAYVPRLVERDQLVAANGRLAASSSIADVGGPGLAGLLVALVGAPFALLVDAVSYAVSAVSLWSIRRPEPVAEPPDAASRDLRRELVDGARTVVSHPVIRALAGEAATFNVFNQVFMSVLLLYATRSLALDPATIGVVLSAGSLGSVAGSVSAGAISRRFGLGRTLVAMMILACSAPLAVPFVAGPPAVVAPVLAAIFAVENVGIAVTIVNAISLRQAATPDPMLARMNATYRTLTYGFVPVGALLGGALGELVGLRATLLVGAVGIFVSPVWVLLSPLRAVRSLADVVPERDAPAGRRSDVGADGAADATAPPARHGAVVGERGEQPRERRRAAAPGADGVLP